LGQPAGLKRGASGPGGRGLSQPLEASSQRGGGRYRVCSDYSSDYALSRLSQLRDFLGSFKQLTARVRGRLTAAELGAVGNTDVEMQSIGFHNIPLTVEGTLIKQDYQLKQAYYELARIKRERGDGTDEDVDRATEAYREAARRFQVFWDTKRPID
jgi:hypothetical protein